MVARVKPIAPLLDTAIGHLPLLNQSAIANTGRHVTDTITPATSPPDGPTHTDATGY